MNADHSETTPRADAETEPAERAHDDPVNRDEHVSRDDRHDLDGRDGRDGGAELRGARSGARPTLGIEWDDDGSPRDLKLDFEPPQPRSSNTGRA